MIFTFFTLYKQPLKLFKDVILKIIITALIVEIV